MRAHTAITLPPGSGYRNLITRAGEYAWRPGPFGHDAGPDLSSCTVLASLVHLTDMHVMDASSPARAEHVQLLESVPKWRPVLAMHRPYELLGNHAFAMMAEAIRRSPVGSTTGAPFEVALVTGDCTDNAQRNELDAYLSILLGGTLHLPYDGVQSPQAGETGFWCPEPEVADEWKRRYGYPSVPGLIDAVSSPLVCAGMGLPMLAVAGNHDVMRQGTALTSASSERWAVGDRKATAMVPGFDPADPLAAFLDEPACFVEGAPTRAVRADADRRALLPGEWATVHQARGAGAVTGADYVHDLEHVRIVVLDTNHPFGHYQGSVAGEQLQWLDARIAESEKWVLVATHHGTESLDNTTPDRSRSIADDTGPEQRRLHADALCAVLHRHDRVLGWLSGHRHINRVTHRSHPDGANDGFWEVITASTIDWPSQARSVEILRTSDGSIVMVCTPIDHAGDVVPGVDAVESLSGLAGLHRELAANLTGPYGTPQIQRLSGRAEDGACVVALRRNTFR